MSSDRRPGKGFRGGEEEARYSSDKSEMFICINNNKKQPALCVPEPLQTPQVSWQTARMRGSEHFPAKSTLQFPWV